MNSVRNSWDEFYLQLAATFATRSKDESTKVGAVIVKDNAIISMGYNGFPRNVRESVPERNERPAKYLYTEHAERNAIYNAARHGIQLLDTTIYVNGLPPCADCARAIIQSGIKQIVIKKVETSAAWRDSCKAAIEMLKEAGIYILILELGE